MNHHELPGNRATAEGLNVHYILLGNGPPVILLHGGAGDWHEWRRSLAFLARTSTVYALDLPGFGRSDPPDRPVTPLWFSSFLGDFMDALQLDSASLLGHSLGGSIALAFALDFPERVNRLVLIDSAGLGELSRTGRRRLSLIMGIKRILGKEKVPRYAVGKWDEWLFLGRLPTLRPPVMLVWGEKDPYLPVSQARLAHRLLPNSRLHIFPGCHHAPHRERPAEFNELVSQFLKP